MTAPTLRVHLLHEPEPESLENFQSLVAPNVYVTAGSAPADITACHVLVAGRPERAHVAENPDLRALVIPWAGLPTGTRELLHDFPQVAVHNLHHNAAPVAEMVAALLLAAAKFIVPMDRALRAHDWSPRYAPNPSPLLAGKTALILGYGAIGQRVARCCRGLDMRVIATRRAPDKSPPDCPDTIYAPSALHDLLPQAHALLICLPLTDETRGLIGERELALLPRDSVLVNVGRGPIVEQGALYSALRDGRLCAAGLDVWYTYPRDKAARTQTPPADYPFHTLDNVVMSPHRGGALGAGETERLRMRALAQLVNAAARGESIPNPVDVKRGY